MILLSSQKRGSTLNRLAWGHSIRVNTIAKFRNTFLPTILNSNFMLASHLEPEAHVRATVINLTRIAYPLFFLMSFLR